MQEKPMIGSIKHANQHQYLKKGAQIYVEGSLVTDKWQDQNGVEKYMTKIRAKEMPMLGGSRGAGNENATGLEPNHEKAKPVSLQDDDTDWDDFPF